MKVSTISTCMFVMYAIICIYRDFVHIANMRSVDM